MLKKDSKIYIAGHKGMVGSVCLKRLKAEGYTNVVFRSSKELDLTNQAETKSFFDEEKPDAVIFAAAKVGGIQANIDAPAEFLYDNLMIQSNVIEASYRSGVSLFVNIGSSCIYPRVCPQPMKEEYLMDGKVEPTNEGYAIAKIAGLKMTAYYKKQYGFRSINLMPCNLYGENDSFDLKHSHVLSALVKRFSDAQTQGVDVVTLWGTGSAKREFMNVADLVEAIVYFVAHPFDDDFLNVGWGTDVSIKELAEMIKDKTGFEGTIDWDTSKPDGMPRKCMDVTRMRNYGFKPMITLEEGIEQMIQDYKKIK
jgi:GDP-L-fucose synthase